MFELFSAFLFERIGSTLTVHLSNGMTFTGLLSEVEGHPGTLMIEPPGPGANASPVLFDASVVIAITLPPGSKPTKKPR